MIHLLAPPILVPAVLLILLLALARRWQPRAVSPDLFLEPLEDEIEPETDSEDLLEDSRAVQPTDVVLLWHHGAAQPEELIVRIDTVSRDNLVFEGATRRFGETERSRRLFHTMSLPTEHLSGLRTLTGTPIPDASAWLAALPEAGR